MIMNGVKNTGARIMTYLCPECGEPGSVIGTCKGYTRSVCRCCRLSFEQPTDQPAHEGYPRSEGHETNAPEPPRTLVGSPSEALAREVTASASHAGAERGEDALV